MSNKPSIMKPDPDLNGAQSCDFCSNPDVIMCLNLVHTMGVNLDLCSACAISLANDIREFVTNKLLGVD